MTSTQAMSKDFLELVRSIGEAKSKQEEDKIILNEIRVLKHKMSEKDVSRRKMKEYLIRMLYVEMLGHEAPFGYINAVNMTHETRLLEKRVGYLAVGLLLHEDHELMILLVNTIQRDLKSSNFLEVCAALNAVCKLMNEETIPAVLPIVTDLLNHGQELVRKKAVMALQRFYRKSPSSISHLHDAIRRALCDKDPSVMAASLCMFYDLAKADPQPFKDLIPSFVSILKQITEHRLSREFDYHRIPAPWIQIKMLKLLALLGADDQSASEGMYEILHEVMKRADTGINAGYAVVYESVRCITRIYPNTNLLEAAATSISRFITSENHNLKYLGITSLASIVGIDRKYAAEHQMVVIDCMEDPDETLKRKTLGLLFKITNSQNVRIICDKMMTFLRQATDHHLRSELVSRITQLAERYAPDNDWFLHTMNTVFELGGDLVQEETAHNLMRLIAEGSGEDEDVDTELKVSAVTTYTNLLENPNIPDILLQVIAWVCGEYAYLCEEYSEDDILNRLCDVLERQHEDGSTRGWIISALAKFSSRRGEIPYQVKDILERYSTSKNVDLQQRCVEVLALGSMPECMVNVLPIDGSCEDLEVDPDLPHLDGYCQLALANGAKAYISAEERNEMELDVEIAGISAHDPETHLKFDAYATPQVGNRTMGVTEEINTISEVVAPPEKEGIQLAGVQRKWGRTGYAAEGIKEQPAAPAAVPTHSSREIFGEDDDSSDSDDEEVAGGTGINAPSGGSFGGNRPAAAPPAAKPMTGNRGGRGGRGGGGGGAGGGAGGNWDQFRENEKKFGYKSTYDDSLYTTEVDKASPLYKETMRRYQKEIRDLETGGKTTDNIHMLEERGQAIDVDEETLYGAVVAGDRNKIKQGGKGAYVPPQRRGNDGAGAAKQPANKDNNNGTSSSSNNNNNKDAASGKEKEETSKNTTAAAAAAAVPAKEQGDATSAEKKTAEGDADKPKVKSKLKFNPDAAVFKPTAPSFTPGAAAHAPPATPNYGGHFAPPGGGGGGGGGGYGSPPVGPQFYNGAAPLAQQHQPRHMPHGGQGGNPFAPMQGGGRGRGSPGHYGNKPHGGVGGSPNQGGSPGGVMNNQSHNNYMMQMRAAYGHSQPYPPGGSPQQNMSPGGVPNPQALAAAQLAAAQGGMMGFPPNMDPQMVLMAQQQQHNMIAEKMRLQQAAQGGQPMPPHQQQQQGHMAPPPQQQQQQPQQQPPQQQQQQQQQQPPAGPDAAKE